jgi:hypothetical protein
MKIKLKLGVLAIVCTAGLFAFRAMLDGSIKGKVIPPDGVVNAWAIANGDTLKARVSYGEFVISGVKPGSYKLVIEAKPPYRNAAKENVVVTDGQATDVGDIKLEK